MEAYTRLVDFDKLRGISDIAQAYGCCAKWLEKIVTDAEEKDSCYEELRLPKKNPARRGEYRVVYDVQCQSLKLLQKNIATSISQQVSFPKYVQGFVGGCSIISNSEQHLAKAFILNADIRNFFKAIATEQVERSIVQMGCASNVANVFAEVCTLSGSLPQGAPSSPILSNLVCAKMDEELCTLGNEVGSVYSRYADDITFSGDAVPTKEMLKCHLDNFGFELHPKKFYVAKRGQAQFVTGLSVFDSELPRIPKQMKRRLRQELFYIKKFGIIEHIRKRYSIVDLQSADRRELKEKARITGLIDFMSSIEPKFGKWARDEWATILGGESFLNYHRPHRNKKL